MQPFVIAPLSPREGLGVSLHTGYTAKGWRSPLAPSTQSILLRAEPQPSLQISDKPSQFTVHSSQFTVLFNFQCSMFNLLNLCTSSIKLLAILYDNELAVNNRLLNTWTIELLSLLNLTDSCWSRSLSTNYIIRSLTNSWRTCTCSRYGIYWTYDGGIWFNSFRNYFSYILCFYIFIIF